MEPADRDELVFRMQDMVAHVATLRKRIRSKIRSRVLRPKLLLHCLTFSLVAMYLQELISNTEAIQSNLGVLNFITSMSFSRAEVARSAMFGNETTTLTTTFGELDDKDKLQGWIRDALLQELLVESTPLSPFTAADKKAAEEAAATAAATAAAAPDDPATAAAADAAALDQNSTREKPSVIARQIKHSNFRLLFGVRLRQLRVVPFDRNSDNEIIRKACLVSRLSRETFYDIDWSQNEFGERTYGWLTSKCYPEWRNDLGAVYDIEAGPGRFTPTMDDAAAAEYNFTYYDPPTERSVPQKAKFSTYPNRGWVVDFALDEPDPLGKFDSKVKDRFIDEQTRAVVVEFTVFMAHGPEGTYSNVRVIFELHPSGGNGNVACGDVGRVGRVERHLSPAHSLRGAFDLNQSVQYCARVERVSPLCERRRWGVYDLRVGRARSRERSLDDESRGGFVERDFLRGASQMDAGRFAERRWGVL